MAAICLGLNVLILNGNVRQKNNSQRAFSRQAETSEKTDLAKLSPVCPWGEYLKKGNRVY